MKLKMDFTDFEKKIKTLSKEKAKKIIDEVDDALLEGALDIERDAVYKAPEHDGELIQSIGVEENHSKNKLQYIVHANAKHAPFVEFGTKPHWTSIKHLKKWAKDKLGDENLAYAIQKKIAKKGTKAQPFMRPAFFKNEDKIKKDVKEAIKNGLKK